MKQKRTKENPDGVMENLLEENASPSKEGENQTVEKTVKDLSPKIVLKRLDAEKNTVGNDEETEPVKSTNKNDISEKEVPNSSEPKDIHENVDDMEQDSIVLDEQTGESK